MGGMTDTTVLRKIGNFSDRLIAPKRAQRVIRRAAGRNGYEDGDRPHEVVVLGSRVAAVLDALDAAGFEVVADEVAR
ncbi:hypothetical protein BJF78_24815 [Pseudonocardia sp. CNS-139]|nr:hypothetical protein BJF78_24815 [Pseudonocardia sp. CNS-139]